MAVIERGRKSGWTSGFPRITSNALKNPFFVSIRGFREQ